MDTRTRRDVLRKITYGVYVLGAAHDDRMDVATVTWVTQASFEPPLVVVGAKKDGMPYSLMKQSGSFALSFLDEAQKDVAFAFFKTAEPVDGRIGGYAYETRETGAPIISRAMGWLEAEIVNADERGDHAIVIGEVVGVGQNRDEKPLTLQQIGLNYGG